MARTTSVKPSALGLRTVRLLAGLDAGALENWRAMPMASLSRGAVHHIA